MENKPRIPKPLRNRPFSLKEVLNKGLSRYYFEQLKSQGAIEKIAWGTYRSTREDLSEEDLFCAAMLKAGKPSAICLLSALSFYDLTDEITRKVWVMVPAGKVLHAKHIKLLRVAHPKWNIGIISHSEYRITSLERTLVDCLTHRRQLGSRIGIDALRVALERKKTTLKQIYDMASKLEVAHRIESYIEVLS